MIEQGRRTLRANGLEFSAITAGPTDGATVLCLHGFPDTPATFRHQLPALAEAGYSVIAPTLRGYEPSSQPADGAYDLESLADDVVGWLDDIGVDRAHLVGHDWGAVITFVVATYHPDRVHTATAMAIPPLARIPEAVRRVPRQVQRSWYMTWFQVRGLSDRSVRARDYALIKRLWRSWSPGYAMSEAEFADIRATFARPGVVGAALAYYRQNATPPIMLGLRSSPATATTTVRAPMLLIHGADDGCMDRRMFDAAIDHADFPRGLQHEEIADAGHFVHLERPDTVTALVLEHLASGSAT